jgi:zinc protease
LLDPGWRPEAEAQAKSSWLDSLEALKTNLSAQVVRKFQWESVRGDPNRRVATLEEAKAVTMKDVRTWFEPVLVSSPMIVSVCGDIDIAATKDLALRYFGSLPERKLQEPIADMTAPGVLPTCPPLPAKTFRFDVPGTVARAYLRIGWQTDDFYDVAQTRRLNVLAEAITERMRERLREELGQAYSPSCHNWMSEAHDGYGCLIATAGVASDKADEAQKIILEITAELADKGVSQELLAHALTPTLKRLATMRQQNSYWLYTVMSRGQVQPQRIEWAKSMEADFASITTEEVSALAKKYLINDKAFQVIGVCAGEAKTGDVKPEEAKTGEVK